MPRRKVPPGPTKIGEISPAPWTATEIIQGGRQEALFKMLQAVLYQLRANAQSPGTAAQMQYTVIADACEGRALDIWNS